MNTEEMKMKKFETIVKKADEILGQTYNMQGSPIVLFLGDSGNDYYKVILQHSFSKRHWRCDTSNMEKQISVDKIINASKYCGRQCKIEDGKGKCNIKYPLIYWLLMAVAVDEEKYNSSLSIVSDAAYILGYNDDMVEDWTNAVKATLLGEDITKIEYKTTDAKMIFAQSRSLFW